MERALELRDRVKELALNEPTAGPWLGMWVPVVAAVVRLAKTLFRLALRLKEAATSETPIDPIDDELKAAVIEDLRDIADEFPDIADVLFGLQHLDRLLEIVTSDNDARNAAAAILGAVGAVVDRFLDALVDIAMGERESPFGPDRVIDLLSRYEEFAQQLLDRWLQPALEKPK